MKHAAAYYIGSSEVVDISKSEIYDTIKIIISQLFIIL